MTPADVERWCARVLGRLERGLRVEDDRVELKGSLPSDSLEAARRIAGHANQVRDDRLLWIIGAREGSKQPVIGEGPKEADAASWWPPVASRFDDVAPSPVWVYVETAPKRSVLAVAFDASRVPYVVKRPGPGAEREVPWRDATRVRAANRFDLLKLLVPIASRPVVSVLGGELAVTTQVSDGARRALGVRHSDPVEPDQLHWHGGVELYVDTADLLVIPDHRCSAELVLNNGVERSLEPWPAPSNRGYYNREAPQGRVADRGDGQLLVQVSSPIRVGVSLTEPIVDVDKLKRRPNGRMALSVGVGGLGPFDINLDVLLKSQRPDAANPRESWRNRDIVTWSLEPV